MEWHCREFRHLCTEDLYAILHARNAVLVVEDSHMHLDTDGKDAGALHVYALAHDGDAAQVAAYARLLPGDDIDLNVTIDKVLTSEARRDDDTLDRLIERALAATGVAWPGVAVRTHVPAHRQALYRRFGFRKAYGPYLEQGESFIGMVRPVDRAAGALRHLLARMIAAPRSHDERRLLNRRHADTGAGR
ncbi:drug:proton antiporter [Burkholderia pyrrocinia]|nr:drug:proton antiporter [Burkholderia pyrrocinia]